MLGKLWKGRSGFIAGHYADNASIGFGPNVVRLRLLGGSRIWKALVLKDGLVKTEFYELELVTLAELCAVVFFCGNILPVLQANFILGIIAVNPIGRENSEVKQVDFAIGVYIGRIVRWDCHRIG